MSLTLIPDAEVLVGNWLRTHADIIALDANVAGRTPTTMLRPWVRLTQIAVRPVQRSPTLHVLDYVLQLDCYAGTEAMDNFAGQAEASLLARTVIAVLEAVEGTTVDDVTVTRVSFGSGPARMPDAIFEPARERFIVMAHLMMHPA